MSWRSKGLVGCRQGGGWRSEATSSTPSTRKPHHGGGAGGLPHCGAVPGAVRQIQERLQGPRGAAVAVPGGESPSISPALSLHFQGRPSSFPVLLSQHSLHSSRCEIGSQAPFCLFSHAPQPLTHLVLGDFSSGDSSSLLLLAISVPFLSEKLLLPTVSCVHYDPGADAAKGPHQ